MGEGMWELKLRFLREEEGLRLLCVKQIQRRDVPKGL